MTPRQVQAPRVGRWVQQQVQIVVVDLIDRQPQVGSRRVSFLRGLAAFGEDHPVVESPATLGATATRSDPHDRGCLLDDIPEADILVGDKPWKAYPVWIAPILAHRAARQVLAVHAVTLRG